jgi:membrane protein
MRLKKRIDEDNVSALSSQLTYYTILSFFPFIMFLLTLLSFTPLTHQDVISQVDELFPTEIYTFIVAILNEMAKKQSNALLSLTVLFTIWSASRGILAIVKSLNIAYRLNETRSGIFIRLASFLYTIIFAIAILISLVLLIFGNRLLDLIDNYLLIPINIIDLIQTMRYILPMLILFIFFIIIYNAIPNRRISIKEVIPGSIFASLGWIVASIGFSIYVDHFGNFTMYGSLAGIIILLLWLYLCSNIIMIGGEINALLVEIKKEKEATIPQN